MAIFPPHRETEVEQLQMKVQTLEARIVRLEAALAASLRHEHWTAIAILRGEIAPVTEP